MNRATEITGVIKSTSAADKLSGTRITYRLGMTSEEQLRRHPLSERVAILSEQVKSIAALSAQYRASPTHTQTGRVAHQERELRLQQIREELARMLEKEI